jgi:hypothetical protein
MLTYALIFIFILSLIPSLRERAKKELKGLYIVMGICLLIMVSIMDFFTYPRLINLYKLSNLSFDYTYSTINLIIGTILSIIILVLGLKFNNFSKNNLYFYLLLGFLLISVSLIIEFNIVAVILPIYQLPSS